MQDKHRHKVVINPSQEIQILRMIMNITNTEWSLKRILKKVVDLVHLFMGSDSVFIYLFDENKKTLTLMASKTPHSKELGQITLKAGEGITGWVAAHKEAVAIPQEAYNDNRFKGFDVLPEDRYEAFLSVPIIHKFDTVGVINLQYKNSHEFSESTISLVSLIGTQVGGVIENARLLEFATNKANQFERLLRVSESIVSERYLDEILALIVVITAQMLHSKICSIMLLDESSNELSIKITQSLSDDYKSKANVKVDNSVIGKAIKRKIPVAIYNVQDEKGYSMRDIALKENLTSLLAVPLIFRGKAIGVVTIYTQEPHVFTKDEINILQIIANHAAVAIVHSNQSTKSKP